MCIIVIYIHMCKICTILFITQTEEIPLQLLTIHSYIYRNKIFGDMTPQL